MGKLWTGWKRSRTTSTDLRSEKAMSTQMQWKEQDYATRRREAVPR
jgi:hypothetical protein